MKKIFLSVLPVAAVVAVLAIQTTADPLPIGSPIPNAELKMKDISGTTVSLADAKTSKGLLVMFSCNTCPYVIKNQARTMEACKYAKSNGIGVAILNSNEAQRSDADSFNDMQEYAKSQGYSWYYLVDQNSKQADAFGANRTPECYLFNNEGKLVYHGAIDDNPSEPEAVTRKHLVLAIDEMKAGKDISVKESRSVGCSIKRL
jgi:hypothetical protein